MKPLPPLLILGCVCLGLCTASLGCTRSHNKAPLSPTALAVEAAQRRTAQEVERAWKEAHALPSYTLPVRYNPGRTFSTCPDFEVHYGGRWRRVQLNAPDELLELLATLPRTSRRTPTPRPLVHRLPHRKSRTLPRLPPMGRSVFSRRRRPPPVRSPKPLNNIQKRSIGQPLEEVRLLKRSIGQPLEEVRLLKRSVGQPLEEVRLLKRSIGQPREGVGAIKESLRALAARRTPRRYAPPLSRKARKRGKNQTPSCPSGREGAGGVRLGFTVVA